ncbi:hypothetical protein MO867_16515 [Microbulbifer sp. OS29]|uniref:Uncharacterized protein n=1 Tax=Microbulbifer okhotskensis TaxID=2926617 RepID=A0A9X2J668_9GAMM|nr:hypothetical protein [Microbulbifer okhotskensis]MCO1335938.1 hypothetical protein [Microbulbifer okhotskensis]
MHNGPQLTTQLSTYTYLSQLNELAHLNRARELIMEWPHSEPREAALKAITEEEKAILPGLLFPFKRSLQDNEP